MNAQETGKMMEWQVWLGKTINAAKKDNYWCNMDISSIEWMFVTTPPLAGHPSIEGNKTKPSVFTARSAMIIPLYGGVARSARVVSQSHLLSEPV
jgi:hypothetical protein